MVSVATLQASAANPFGTTIAVRPFRSEQPPCAHDAYNHDSPNQPSPVECHGRITTRVASLPTLQRYLTTIAAQSKDVLVLGQSTPPPFLTFRPEFPTHYELLNLTAAAQSGRPDGVDLQSLPCTHFLQMLRAHPSTKIMK